MGRGAAGHAVDVAKHLLPVGQIESQRLDDCHCPRRLALEVVAQCDVQAGVVGPAASLAGTRALGQQAQAAGGVATPPQAGDRGHARVVPATDNPFLDQLAQLSLAGHDGGHVQAGEFVLVRSRLGQQAQAAEVIEQPVVERTLVFELEGADAVGDVLQRVFDRMREGVHRIDAPRVAGVVVRGPLDAVQRRIAQIDVRAGHVDLGAQHGRAVV